LTGAEVILKTAAAAGVDICFANPGTTELPLVAALDTVKAIRPVLGLFEGVCTGAADGYGRIKQKPALTLLHLGPGLANGIANLHNARRARDGPSCSAFRISPKRRKSFLANMTRLFWWARTNRWPSSVMRTA
jgi:glyoxylate carboligase